jgi:hypothetical protein
MNPTKTEAIIKKISNILTLTFSYAVPFPYTNQIFTIKIPTIII